MLRRFSKWADDLKKWRCHHEFAIEDLKIVNEQGWGDRVAWECAKCGKLFRAHCGLDITPENGPMFRRRDRTDGDKTP